MKLKHLPAGSFVHVFSDRGRHHTHKWTAQAKDALNYREVHAAACDYHREAVMMGILCSCHILNYYTTVAPRVQVKAPSSNTRCIGFVVLFLDDRLKECA